MRADGQVGPLKRSLHDGRRRENVGHSARYKPSLAYSAHVKEGADTERDAPRSPLARKRGSTPPELFENEPDVWSSKTYLGALLKLKTSGEAGGRHLRDLPRLLESLAYEKGIESPPFDLKIPRVRLLSSGAELPWEAALPEGGAAAANGLPPRPAHKKTSFISSGSEKHFWPYNDGAVAAAAHPADSFTDLGNKQPRKKRGRYRQYNTELLEEAIAVVLGGRMSVSKAQSVYGIPHSTLEYKVKERLGTLKNPPKKKPKPGGGAAEEGDGAASPEGKGCRSSEEGDGAAHSGMCDAMQESPVTS